MKNHSIRHLTIAALLIGMGIVIPMVMPKIVIGPASFTLASHVPVFVAMFFSPAMAIAVALGTTFGFFLTLPPIIALRALSHVVFAVIGAFYLQKHPDILLKNGKPSLLNIKFQSFNLIIGLIHSAVEMAVVAAFYFTGNVPGTAFDGNFYYFLFVLMGIGGLIHSLIDFNLAYFVAGALSKQFDIRSFSKAKGRLIQKQKKAA
ncbi:niacin transporter [Enterococcus casseliflavus]|uniref:hypothetical protein n=1 Tax=Enterococcus casseliflavus TaxID=37734 RepID=UPI0008EFCBE9|nr:hypothetical protein [Enterococcus casseliflavus]SFD39563.1 niacin transporter [Enterococcus casseliflavus]